MMHPMMPPATGPTGALLIMFKDATSSSGERAERRQEGKRHLKGQYPTSGHEEALIRHFNGTFPPLRSLTHEPKAVCIGALCTHDAPKTLFLQGAVRLVQMSLAVTVDCAPLAVQHTEAVAGTRQGCVRLLRRETLKRS